MPRVPVPLAYATASPEHMSAAGLTRNGKFTKMDNNYTGKKNHPTAGLLTRLLGFAPNYWAFHPTTGLCTRLLGFAPDCWALHTTTGLSSECRFFDPTPKSPHSTDQRTFMCHFPLNPGPLLTWLARAPLGPLAPRSGEENTQMPTP